MYDKCGVIIRMLNNVAINCGDPGKPSNGIVIGNDYKFGATMEYECIDGYVLVGAKTGKCQDDGLWSHETPYCKSKCFTLAYSIIPSC